MEVIKFSLAPTLITEEERRILGQAIAICERVLVNAVAVVEVEADPIPPESYHEPSGDSG